MPDIDWLAPAGNWCVLEYDEHRGWISHCTRWADVVPELEAEIRDRGNVYRTFAKGFRDG